MLLCADKQREYTTIKRRKAGIINFRFSLTEIETHEHEINDEIKEKAV